MPSNPGAFSYSFSYSFSFSSLEGRRNDIEWPCSDFTTRYIVVVMVNATAYFNRLDLYLGQSRMNVIRKRLKEYAFRGRNLRVKGSARRGNGVKKETDRRGLTTPIVASRAGERHRIELLEREGKGGGGVDEARVFKSDIARFVCFH